VPQNDLCFERANHLAEKGCSVGMVKQETRGGQDHHLGRRAFPDLRGVMAIRRGGGGEPVVGVLV